VLQRPVQVAHEHANVLDRPDGASISHHFYASLLLLPTGAFAHKVTKL
jgi:hypothetical protein